MSDNKNPEDLSETDLEAIDGGGKHSRWIEISSMSQGVSGSSSSATPSTGHLKSGEEAEAASGHYTQVVWAKT